jgi:ADP-heptose:LPS heptosyltransferase
MQRIHLHNGFHLGDGVWTIHFLRKLCAAEPDFSATLYVQPWHIPELKLHIIGTETRLALEPFHRRPATSINAHVNADDFFTRYATPEKYDQLFVDFFSTLARKIGYASPIHTTRDLLFDHPAALEPTPLSRPFDWLLINSRPLSNQIEHDPQTWRRVAEALLEKGCTVVTTAPTGTPAVCTRDHGLSLIGIANVAMHARHVAAIHTSPLLTAMNVWSIEMVERWFVLDRRHHFHYNERIDPLHSTSQLMPALQRFGFL